MLDQFRQFDFVGDVAEIVMVFIAVDVTLTHAVGRSGNTEDARVGGLVQQAVQYLAVTGVAIGSDVVSFVNDGQIDACQ